MRLLKRESPKKFYDQHKQSFIKMCKFLNDFNYIFFLFFCIFHTEIKREKTILFNIFFTFFTTFQKLNITLKKMIFFIFGFIIKTKEKK